MARCYRCDTLASDPVRGTSPWARAVVAGRQVLICPECQARHPDWSEDAQACKQCGSKRLARTLGETVCRNCGHTSAEDAFSLE